MRLLPVFTLTGSVCMVLLLCTTQVHETETKFAYAIKGFVNDVRRNPYRFIGGIFFKKAIILLKLKIKWKIKKKIILKLLLKKLLFERAHHPHYVYPPYHPSFVGPVSHSASIALGTNGYFGRKKRSVRFPDDSPSSYGQTDEHLNYEDLDMEDINSLPRSIQQAYKNELRKLTNVEEEPNDNDIMEHFAMASEFDGSSCIPKSICVVMAQGNRTTNDFENAVLDFYNSRNELEEIRGRNSPANVYEHAFQLGRSARSEDRCSTYFRQCPDSSHVTNLFMNEIFSSDVCDPPLRKFL